VCDITECDISKLNDISEYLRIISECDIICPLEFWKKWQNHLLDLAKIAKKYQGVQAACERMFSTAGNIFSLNTEKCQYYYLPL